MTYKIIFKELALKEFKKLDRTIQTIFKEKLKERSNNPKVPKDKLHNAKDCYKIKLRTFGFRLIYQVKDDCLMILVLKIGKRENDEVYKNLNLDNE